MSEGQWKNRIVGTDEVPPEQLLANPRNFRRHSRDQQDAMTAILEDVGWVSEVIVNQVTGHVVDGHMRVELAMRQGAPTVPVRYVTLTPEEENKILATFDPISGMAFVDKDALRDLLGEVPEVDDDRMTTLFGKLSREASSGVKPTSWLDRFEDDNMWDDEPSPAPSGNGAAAEPAAPPPGSVERPVEGDVHPDPKDIDQPSFVVVNFTVPAEDRGDVREALAQARSQLPEGATSGDALIEVCRAYLRGEQ